MSAAFVLRLARLAGKAELSFAGSQLTETGVAESFRRRLKLRVSLA